jgi:NADH-quinone oxidoreductase subunit J
MIEQLAFLVLAAATLLAAIGVVTARSVFLSALWLVAAFIGVAGLYILLDAGFLAMIQILVYVGAISVLILFAVMLTRDIMVEDRPTGHQRVVGLAMALALFGFLAALGYRTDWPVHEGALVPDRDVQVSVTTDLTGNQIAAIDGVVTQRTDDGAGVTYVVPSTTAAIGRAFMTTYLLPFEIIGAILLVAMVGAIVIARE